MIRLLNLRAGSDGVPAAAPNEAASRRAWMEAWGDTVEADVQKLGEPAQVLF